MAGFDIQGFQNPLKPSEINGMRKLGSVKGIGRSPGIIMTASDFFEGLMDSKMRMHHHSTRPNIAKSSLSTGREILICEPVFTDVERPRHDEYTSHYQFAMPRAGKVVIVPEVKIAVQNCGEFFLSDDVISMSRTLVSLGDATRYLFSFSLVLDEAASELAAFRYPHAGERMRKASVYVINPRVDGKGDVNADLAIEPKFNTHFLDYVGTDGALLVTSMKGYLESRIGGIEKSGKLSEKAKEFRKWMEKSVHSAGQIAEEAVEALGKDLGDAYVFNFLRVKYDEKRDWDSNKQ